jgi:hypothetical protein
MRRPTTIYGLIDPRTDQLRYVGKTSASLEKRLSAHVARCNLLTKRHSSRWLKGLADSGLHPEIFEIEIVQAGGDWIEAEQFWIAYFRSIGADLTNICVGGEGVGGYKFSPERKQELSEKFKGRIFDPEWRRRISIAKRGKPVQKLSSASKAKRIASRRETLRRRAETMTHCSNGHELSGDNAIRWAGAFKLGCRQCRRDEYRAKHPLKARVSKPIRLPSEPKYVFGEAHPQAKLTWSAVNAIRVRCAWGERRIDVGASFGVALTTVDQIIQLKCWKPEKQPAALVD